MYANPTGLEPWSGGRKEEEEKKSGKMFSQPTAIA